VILRFIAMRITGKCFDAHRYEASQTVIPISQLALTESRDCAEPTKAGTAVPQQQGGSEGWGPEADSQGSQGSVQEKRCTDQVQEVGCPQPAPRFWSEVRPARRLLHSSYLSMLRAENLPSENFCSRPTKQIISCINVIVSH
jgi:hypothetical protein